MILLLYYLYMMRLCRELELLMVLSCVYTDRSKTYMIIKSKHWTLVRGALGTDDILILMYYEHLNKKKDDIFTELVTPIQ